VVEAKKEKKKKNHFSSPPNICHGGEKEVAGSEPTVPASVNGASSNPAIVQSGWEKEASANVIQQDGKSLWLGCLPGSCRESSFWAGDPCSSWDEMGAQEENIHERIVSRKQKNKRLTEDLDRAGMGEFPHRYLVSACTPVFGPGGTRPCTAVCFPAGCQSL